MKTIPPTGTQSTCVMCQQAIEFTGKYWQHVDSSPRHPASPPKEPEQSADDNPQTTYGPLELTGTDARNEAKKLLERLWFVSGLEARSPFADPAVIAARLYAWQMMANVLLGDDHPTCMELT